ncbi:MAG TPA: nodulation protein NfeD [Candidatus Limnocylindrales bacterium]|nr:nodulation protein NfeD [Candidatus Limnocylindrales bacterium]
MRSHPVDVIGRIAAACLLGGLAVTLLTSGARAASPTVALLPTTGIVDQVMATYIEGGLATAAERGDAAAIIELDTPGGSLDSMQDIVGSILSSKVPVIVWVAPAGGHAASAGTFITLAANLALMAPGTNIGAASPVDQSGGTITGTEGQKVLNDAVAKITSIAEERGRNVDWAVSAVKDAASASAQQAVSLKVVDGLAASLGEVLAFADGRTVSVAKEPVILQLAGAQVDRIELNPLQGFLHLLADPNIAFLLFTVGFYGLLFEVVHPNFVTGILGGIAILLAFIGFGSLPLNVAGLLLIALGLLLFMAELWVTSHGLLTVGGVVAIALGGAALYTAPSNPAAPDVGVALPVLGVVLALGLGFAALIAAVAARSHGLRGTAGTVGTALRPGSLGEVRRPLGPLGSVYLGGEEWSARTADERPLPRGAQVRVVRQDGLTLIVEPAVDPSAGPQARTA